MPAPLSPEWAPPRPPPPGWLPLVVLVVVLAVVAGAFYVADRSGRRPAATAALSYVPVDGAVQWVRRETTRGETTRGETTRGETTQEGTSRDRRTTASWHVTESARLNGPAAILALDWSFGTAVLAAVGLDEAPRMRFWRTTSTHVGSATSSQQDVGLHRINGAVELVGESGPGGGYVYRPALVELPADVAPGRQWSSAGSAGAELTYRSEFRAEPASEGCLRVLGTVDYLARSGQPARSVRSDALWCTGAGRREATASAGGVTVTDRTGLAPRTARELRTQAEPWLWSDPARWTHKRFEAMSQDPNFGEGQMASVPGAAPPVVTASGLVVRATAADDLVAFTPKTATAWTSVWRMHPGGRVMALAAFGDVVVVTTSLRAVIGYTDGGVRLWQRDLTDVGFYPPVRVSATRLAVADAAGHLQVLDIATGATVWSKEVGAQLVGAPVANEQAVVTIDAGNAVTAWNAEDGSRLWSQDVQAGRAVVVGDTVALHSGSTIQAIALTDGRFRWLRPTNGTVDALAAFGDRTVVATQLETLVLGPDGSVLGRLPPYAALTVHDRRLVGWGASQAEVRDDRLGLVATFDTPDVTQSAGLAGLGYRQGVWAFDTNTWAFDAWSDEP